MGDVFNEAYLTGGYGLSGTYNAPGRKSGSAEVTISQEMSAYPEIKTHKWLVKTVQQAPGKYIVNLICGQCRKTVTATDYNYCPYCGEKMI